MKNILKKYLQIFNLKTVLELNVFFALIEEESNTVCSKKMEGVGGWRCQDCAKSESTIFCQDCWSKMKDKHKILIIALFLSENSIKIFPAILHLVFQKS